jgi:hypothetical protein
VFFILVEDATLAVCEGQKQKKAPQSEALWLIILDVL